MLHGLGKVGLFETPIDDGISLAPGLFRWRWGGTFVAPQGRCSEEQDYQRLLRTTASGCWELSASHGDLVIDLWKSSADC